MFDSDLPTLHIRCGSDIRDKLKAAGFASDYLEFSDPYAQGPVRTRPAPEFLAERARFIAASCGATEAEAAEKLAASERGLAEAGRRYRRIVLWFEHDSYDQLILARLLAHFSREMPAGRLELIAVDRFPGVARFIGLGQLTAEQLATLWPDRKEVTERQLLLGAEVWDALRQPEPTALFALAKSDTPALPMMAPALLRHLRELPGTGDGLAMTQYLALEMLHDGPKTPGELFAAAQAREPLPFLGDTMFFAILKDMLRASAPPFAWDERLTLTAVGRELLEGKRDWLACGPPERWVGGVRIGDGSPDWRWSWERGGPVLV
jgi:hypothetical protein